MKHRTITPAAVSALNKGDLENFLVAATPGGIERQEAMGQAAFVGTPDSLPQQGSVDNRASLEAIGFVFGEPIDDLFIEVRLPKGWSKKATDHSMWSELLDEEGRKRAGIFYKAAYYDRRADIRFRPRYRVNSEYPGAPRDYSECHQQVTDHDGKVLFDPGMTPRAERKPFEDLDRKKCEDWLDQSYPDWKNPFAYW